MGNISDNIGEMAHEFKEALTERELIEHSKHKRREHLLLRIRNIAVLCAMILFIYSLIHHVPYHATVRGIGYVFGAIAYFTELLMMTDCFHKKLDHNELFMAYCFFPMYIIFGITYILE